MPLVVLYHRPSRKLLRLLLCSSVAIGVLGVLFLHGFLHLPTRASLVWSLLQQLGSSLMQVPFCRVSAPHCSSEPQHKESEEGLRSNRMDRWDGTSGIQHSLFHF